MHLVIFGWGNESRGDDGFGPLLLRRLEQAAWPDTACIEDFQLQIEHALDLRGADLALFLDAGRDTPAPFQFTEIFPSGGLTHTSHALPPQSVLDVFRQVEKTAPPPSFLLCVRGESFGLGEGLSPQGMQRLELASAFLTRLGADRRPESWRSLAAS